MKRDGVVPGRTAGADAIAVGLQHLFASIVDEPVPAEFLALLEQIDKAEEKTPPNMAIKGDLPTDGLDGA